MSTSVREAEGEDVAPARQPAVYIPTLYFAEGLPYTIVNTMSVVLFKTLGASNEFIGLTSFLAIPWTVKLFWAPLVDVYGTRRQWILVCQAVLGAIAAAAALGCLSVHAIYTVLVLLFLMAVSSATHDVAIDGFYLDVLDREQQAFYVGIRNAAYKVAWLLGSGGLVFMAGKIGERYSVETGWVAALAACAALFFAAWLFHGWYLPSGKGTAGGGAVDGVAPGLTLPVFMNVFGTYFKQPAIAAIVAYILLFRLGDALMLKMAQPFLLDAQAAGGLGISTADVGLIYGTVGMLFLLVGGIFGGVLVARGGLKRWLLPTAVIQNGAILLYWLLAVHKPGVHWVYVVNSLEQFAYGLGVAAYTVFLLSTVKYEYRAAHYAIATGLMALGLLVPGAVSGYLSTWLGYAGFFLVSFFASIPGMVAIFFLPLETQNQKGGD